MSKMEKTIIYFKNYGPENTNDVIKAVYERIKEKDINKNVCLKENLMIIFIIEYSIFLNKELG
jgi:hypothetical protein